MVTQTEEHFAINDRRVYNETALARSPPAYKLSKLSKIALLILVAFLLITTFTVSYIVYTFSNCNQTATEINEHTVCQTMAVAHSKLLDNDNKTDPLNKQNKLESDVRLPRSVKPLTYNISLQPYLYEGNFTFDGEIKMKILILEDCYNVTMHAVDLNISRNEVTLQRLQNVFHKNSTLVQNMGYMMNISKQYLLQAKQFYIIELHDKLEKGNEYLIYIKFNGVIQDYLQGFYRSSYRNALNETRWLASTQFQATDARRAFPCFDEPALKAKFILNIARPKGMSVVSNMPILATKPHSTMEDYEWDCFVESLPMSTYLVAYTISDFAQKSIGNFSVWARNEAIQSAAYALSIGPKILKFLEEFFDLTFPLPKIDMIALPDFQADGMENWGLIAYRESAMIFEEGISSSTYKLRIAYVVGHELSHQWFGNLVTPSWWSDIWLNEGFASYMEYLTVDAIEPQWKTMDQFVVNELQTVFQLDALSSSHKISVEVDNPEEIMSIFDRISYVKGSTIIRMMNNFLTTPVFRKGLSNYLKEKAYNSANQDDLWYFLTEEAKLAHQLDGKVTVKEIMDTWTLQTGYPLIDITVNRTTNIIHLQQQRFLYVNTNGEDVKEEEPLWWIPITYTTAEELNFDNTQAITWIPRTKVYEMENRNLSLAQWFIFNIQQNGYYRINYDTSNWQAITNYLIDPLKFRKIISTNRAQLIDDSMNLARAGYLNYDIALNLTRYLKHELDYVPWKAAINAFNFIDSMFITQGEYDLLKNYLLNLLENVYNTVDFNHSNDDSDMLKHIKRYQILSMACHLGHRGCITECIRQFQNWLQAPNPDKNNPITPNLRELVYCTAIQHGTELEWNYAYERYRKSSVSTEKELLLSALGCTKEPWMLYRYLHYSTSEDYHIRKQDIYRVFAAVASNIIGQRIAFDFIRNNWKDIKTYMGSSMANLHTLLKFAAKPINSKYHLAELETFVRNDLKDSSRTIQQILEYVEVNINWMERNYQTIANWLRREANSNSTFTISLF